MAKSKDFATGKPVDLSKPEEQVRQDYERVLVESYGYRKGELDIEVSIPRGTGYFPDKADIVVYGSTSGRDPARDVWGIVETKRSERDDGIDQLKSYMTATSAVWAVWTNGKDIEYLYKDVSQNAVLEDYLYNIPDRGQTTAVNIEQELLCESELAMRFALFVCDAENERFEDGMDSVFANRVRESIVNYGPIAVAAWERVLWQMENANETGEELLRQFGLIEHHPSRARRLRVLKHTLKSPDSRIRDAASLGLSFLDDTSALLALQSAYRRETESWLKENLKLVIDQLMDSDNAEIPQSGTSGSLV